MAIYYTHDVPKSLPTHVQCCKLPANQRVGKDQANTQRCTWENRRRVSWVEKGKLCHRPAGGPVPAGAVAASAVAATAARFKTTAALTTAAAASYAAVAASTTASAAARLAAAPKAATVATSKPAAAWQCALQPRRQQELGARCRGDYEARPRPSLPQSINNNASYMKSHQTTSHAAWWWQ
jgi:hypothetical protein